MIRRSKKKHNSKWKRNGTHKERRITNNRQKKAPRKRGNQSLHQTSQQVNNFNSANKYLNNFNHNSFTHLSMHKNKEGNQEEHQDSNKTKSQGNTTTNTTITRSYDQIPTFKGLSIIAIQPNTFDVLNKIDEVVGGIDGGCQEETTNLQEGVTKVGSLPQVCMQGWTQTIVHTLEPLITLGISNRRTNNNRFNYRCRLEVANIKNMDKIRKIAK